MVFTISLNGHEVLPEIFPMLYFPGVVTLVRRDAVALPVTEKFLQVLGVCVE
jgi:hypothetical protein